MVTARYTKRFCINKWFRHLKNYNKRTELFEDLSFFSDANIENDA